MKIGIIADTIFRENRTGVGRSNKTLVDNIVRMKPEDMEIYLIHCGKTTNTSYNNYGIKEICIKEGWELPKFPLSATMTALHRPLFLRGFDIIHYPDSRPPINFWMTGSKTLLTQHGIAPLILERNLSSAGELFLNHLLKWISKKADLHITVSQSEKYQLTQKFGLPEDKIEVIYHGVEHDKFKPFKNHDILFNSLRDKFGIEVPYILHVSSCMNKKNVVRIVQAFARIIKQNHISHRLVIAGSGGTGYKDMLVEIEASKIKDRVILTGHIGDEWLPKLYAAADMLVFPSLHESFGLPILESMACGTPVVTSNVYSMPEIAGDAGVLVDPEDVNSIAKGIWSLLSDEGYKRELSFKGIQRAKMFTWERCAKEHLRVYKNLL